VVILLDTHILLWLLNEPGRVPRRIMVAVEDIANQVLFSPVTIFEVATKALLGRPDFPFEPQETHRAAITAGLRELPLKASAAARIGELRMQHRDPFDRLLLAQALDEDAILATVDRKMAAHASVVRMITP